MHLSIHFTLLLFVMYQGSPNALDICGKHAILVETSKFFVSQPFKQDIPLDFKQFIDIFANLDEHMSKFEAIAANYSTEQLLSDKEPLGLIPFTPTKNLFKVTTMQKQIPLECQKQNAQVVGMEPQEKSLLVEILKKQNLSMVPFFTFPLQQSIYSPNLQIIDSPVDASTKISPIANTLFPYLLSDGSISYPLSNSNSTDAVSTALCSKPNNYWDRPIFRTTFLSTLRAITNSLPKIKTLKDTISKLPLGFKNLATSSLPLVAAKYLLSVPPVVSEIRSFFQKFNNIESWESSTPEQFKEFTKVVRDVKTLTKQYKNGKNLPTSNIFSNFLSSSKSITVPNVNTDQLLNYFKLDQDQFGIDGPVTIQPISQSPDALPTSIMATITTRIYDKTDILKIYTVKPLLHNNNIITVTHVTRGERFSQASIQEPTPFGCSTINDDKVCRGFQTPGVEDDYQHNLLACGRALTLKNDADISKCPWTPAPNLTLAYRSECIPGTQSVVLSSASPVAISTVCDNVVVNSQIFKTFPTYIDTECEIRATLNDAERVLLPQLQIDFHQQQQIGNVFTEPTPLLTTPAPGMLQLSPLQVILISTIGAALASISVIFMILAIFDPTRCYQAIRGCCCVFHCFSRWCKLSNCQNGCLPEREKELQINKNYYPSGASIASAPPTDSQPQEMVRFLPQRSPYVSRMSSVNDIRRADSVSQLEVERPRQLPSNPNVPRFHPK